MLTAAYTAKRVIFETPVKTSTGQHRKVAKGLNTPLLKGPMINYVLFFQLDIMDPRGFAGHEACAATLAVNTNS